MSDPHELEAELHRHAAGLRSIARDLLRDPHAAEDVTQETLRQALAERNLQPGPLGGWLQRTLVNFTYQWRRRERRRLEREASLPLPEPVGAPPDMLSRRETLQAVTSAVLSLDEPYQTAIFQRYFENLSPRAICQRTGANLATVKSRLQRGLVMLRTRLDRQSGGDTQRWRMALLFAFGLPIPAAAAGLTLTGAWLLGTTTKTLVAAGLLCAGGLFAYTFSQDFAPRQNTTTKVNEIADTAIESSTPGSKHETVLREAAASAAEESLSWLDHPYLFELDAFVVDETGLPVKDHTLRIAPPGCTFNDASAPTGADGHVLLSWHSRVPSGEVVISDERGTLRRVALRHGARAAVTLGQAGPKPRLNRTMSFRVVSIKGQGIRMLEGAPVLGTIKDGSDDETRTGLHPHAMFGDRAAEPAKVPGEPEGPSLMLGEGMTFALSSSDIQLVGDKVADNPPPQLARITGTVFGEDGKPAKGIPVALMTDGPQPLARTATNDDGQFEFDKLQPGDFTVRAGGTSDGLATVATVTTTGTTPTTLNLHRDSCVRGHATDASGHALAGATVTWRAADGTWCDTAQTEDDGSFVLANLPGTTGTVFLWEPSGKFPLPVHTETNVLADTADLLLKVDATTTSAVQFELGLPEGLAAADVSGRLWNLDNDIGTRLKRPEAGKPWRLENLPAGWYRIEMFAPGSGWLDGGRQWVDGKADCNLGRIDLRAAAKVHLHLDPETLPAADQQVIELYEVRADVDVRVNGAEIKPDCELNLPAGNYALAWKAKGDTVRFQRFSVRAGETAEITPSH
jgi:RNA polymerase sigma-70 factor, ECF subfamily